MAVFTAGELYDVALGIETNGIEYYSTLAEKVSDAQLKQTYADLAMMERRHLELFEEMRAATIESGPVVTADTEQEYDAYLRALIDSAVFPDDEVAREMAATVAGPAEALQLAIGAEKDSILFYVEMRDLVPAREREAVDRIIREERMHLRDLSDLKRHYS